MITVTLSLIQNVIYIYLISRGAIQFAKGPRDLDSIQGQVIPKTRKLLLDASLA